MRIRHAIWCSVLVICTAGCAARSFAVRDQIVTAPGVKLHPSDSTVSFATSVSKQSSPCNRGHAGRATIDVSSGIGSKAKVTIDLPDFRTSIEFAAIAERDLREAIQKLTPCKLTDADVNAIVRLLPRPTEPGARLIPLVSGMRLRVEREGGAVTGGGLNSAAALTGVGTVWVGVVSDVKDGVTVRTYFEPFERAQRSAPEGVRAPNQVVLAGLGVDINEWAEAEKTPNPFWLLRVPGLAMPGSIEKYGTLPAATTANLKTQMTIVGAPSRAGLLSATLDPTGVAADPPCGTAVLRCVVFPGHTYVVPEIAITVRGHSEYVAVGTTLGDLLARATDLSIRPSELNRAYCRRLRVSRRFGGSLIPVAIKFDKAAEWLRIGLAHGDVVSW